MENKIEIVLAIVISLPLLFFLFRQLFFSSKDSKLPPLPKDFKMSKKNISEALARGYSFKEIHKGLDEPIGDIVKSTNKYVLAFLIFLLVIIIIGVAFVIIMLKLNYKN